MTGIRTAGSPPLHGSTYDKPLVLVMLFLVLFGALMIYSSTSVVTPLLAKKKITEFHYFKRHLFTMALGTLGLLLAYRLRPSTVERMALPLLIFSLVLLGMVFLPVIGVTAGGARRWIRLWPTTFQPSELVKLAMVIYLARYLSSKDFDPDSLRSFVKPLAVMAFFQVIFLRQPDFGATMSLGLLTFGLLFIAGVRLRYLASLGILALPVVALLVLAPYRLKRITSFLDPWKDPQGTGFQLIQSYIALGSGGVAGLGLGESKQKLSFLPASHTDFIFCLVGEELGLIGASVVVGLFLAFFLRSISIAGRTRDEFQHLLAYGLAIMIALQALINFSVVTGLVPTKGLPLPFMSYGGSALLVNMVAVGLLLRISKGDDMKPVPNYDNLITMKRARRHVAMKRGGTR